VTGGVKRGSRILRGEASDFSGDVGLEFCVVRAAGDGLEMRILRAGRAMVLRS
jgi:hypothetical protein